MAFIMALVLIKYKPMYEIKVSGKQLGYTTSKQALSNKIESSIVNYENKNIESIELKNDPEYEFKLVEKAKESNEDEIIIALQKDLEITYKYYEIAQGEESIEKVNTIEDAQKIVEDIKEKTEGEIELSINEQTTKDLEEITINKADIAEANIVEKLNIDENEEIAKIEGIKVGNLPVQGKISSRYGESSRIRSSTHTGLDIVASRGTPIKAVANGTVIFAARNGSYGNLVKIDHGDGVVTWYAHTNEMYVKEGQKVKDGDVIATVGSTGNSTGAHLHFEIRINGNHVNPQKYLYK